MLLHDGRPFECFVGLWDNKNSNVTLQKGYDKKNSTYFHYSFFGLYDAWQLPR